MVDLLAETMVTAGNSNHRVGGAPNTAETVPNPAAKLAEAAAAAYTNVYSAAKALEGIVELLGNTSLQEIEPAELLTKLVVGNLMEIAGCLDGACVEFSNRTEGGAL